MKSIRSILIYVFFDSIVLMVHKEDFDGVIKNLQEIHKEFLNKGMNKA